MIDETDDVDAIMLVMGEAFDPAYGEAWTRRQIYDAFVRPRTFCLISFSQAEPSQAQGFALSRQVLDEEELLLIAVRPSWRGQGVAKTLLTKLREAARKRGTTRIFLEMRDGNPAATLYRSFGFEQIGRRPSYYRSAADGPIDALTFALSL